MLAWELPYALGTALKNMQEETAFASEGTENFSLPGLIITFPSQIDECSLVSKEGP